MLRNTSARKVILFIGVNCLCHIDMSLARKVQFRESYRQTSFFYKFTGSDSVKGVFIYKIQV